MEFGNWNLELGNWNFEFGFWISTSCASTATLRNTRRVRLQTTMIGNVSTSPDRTRKRVLGTKRGVALRCVNGGDRNRLLRQNHQADPRFGIGGESTWEVVLDGKVELMTEVLIIDHCAIGSRSGVDDGSIDNRSSGDRFEEWS